MPTLRENGAALHYLEQGRGEPVLLLHGLGSSCADWEYQIAALSPRYRVIALDARGSGQSRDLSRPGGPFSVRQLADDARAVLERLGAAPAHVIGLSMGGMIAFQLAVDAPQVVRSLTIINSGPAFVPETLREHLAIAVRRILTALLPPARIGAMLAPRLFPDPSQEHLRQQFIERMGGNEPRAYRATLRAIVGWSVADRIGSIAVPALIVASSHDYTPVARKQAYARRMPRARVVVVDGTHHAVPVEAPGKLNPLLLSFLAEHRAPEALPPMSAPAG